MPQLGTALTFTLCACALQASAPTAGATSAERDTQKASNPGSSATAPQGAKMGAVTHAPWLDVITDTTATGQVRDTHGLPIEGAQVVLDVDGQIQEFTTDAKGCFSFELPKAAKLSFEVSHEGFERFSRKVHHSPFKKIAHLRFIMRPVAGMTVEVSAGMLVKAQPQLREEIITTEIIRPMDIQKINAVSLNEAVDCKPGVSVQNECSICNVRNVVLNNLPGRFTTIMIDGVPIFSSVSSAYGLDMIGVNGVESIDVSRGAGVSLIAPEALAGSVNVVSRVPEKAERSIEIQGGQGSTRRLDAFFAQPFSKGAVTASFMGNTVKSLDGNGNGASEYSGYKRFLGGIGLFHNDLLGFKSRARLDLVKEDRGGGALGTDYDVIKREMSGNPFDWRGGKGGSPDARGWIRPDGDFDQADQDGQNPIRLPNGQVLVPYNDGRGGFSEIIHTKRAQGIYSGERDLGNNQRLKIALGAAHHDQDSFYEGDFYKAKQKQFFVEGSFQWFLSNTLVTAGLNYRYEDLASEGVLKDGAFVKGLDNYAYRTPAAYLQAYHAFLDGKVEFNGSVRMDDNNVFGKITTPRLNFLWHHNSRMNSRIALGRGFRLPTSFFEQDHGILSTTRIDRHIDKPETSDNASYTFSLGSEHFAWVVSASYNRIKNFAMLDSGAVDAVTGEPITLFTASPDPLTVKGLDGTFTWKLPHHLEATLGAESYRYDFTPGTLSFARPEERAYLRLDYDSESINAYIRGTWTGTQDLARFYDYANSPRFNMNGTSMLAKSPAYWTVDLSGSYTFKNGLGILLSVNNVFDFKQTDHEDFLWIDPTGGYDVTQVWGPGRGRFVQAGLRWKF